MSDNVSYILGKPQVADRSKAGLDTPVDPAVMQSMRDRLRAITPPACYQIL